MSLQDRDMAKFIGGLGFGLAAGYVMGLLYALMRAAEHGGRSFRQ